MSENDIRQLFGKFDKMEAIQNEKWSAHDKRSDERWMDLSEQLNEIKNEFRSRPCQLHGEMMTDLNGRVKTLEKSHEGVSTKLWWVLAAVLSSLIAAFFDAFRRK